MNFNSIVFDVTVGEYSYSGADDFLAMMAMSTISNQIFNSETSLIIDNNSFVERNPSGMYELTGLYKESGDVGIFSGLLKISDNSYSFSVEKKQDKTFASFEFDNEMLSDVAVQNLNMINSWA